MAKGRTPDTPRTHPDPEWWLAHALIGPTSTPSDLCHYCGHVRLLHVNGCRSTSAGLFDSRPCDCTNTAIGKLYHNPRRLS